jgi:hypothetical protein
MRIQHIRVNKKQYNIDKPRFKTTYYIVSWIEDDIRAIRRVETFDNLESANIFAFELKKNQYLLNNL